MDKTNTDVDGWEYIHNWQTERYRWGRQCQRWGWANDAAYLEFIKGQHLDQF